MSVCNKLAYNRDQPHLWRIHNWGVRRMGLFALLLTWMVLLGGCGFLSGPEVEPTPTQPAERELVPTWTPTPVQPTSAPEPPPATPLPPAPAPDQEDAAPAQEDAASTPAQEDTASTPAQEDPAPAPTDTPASAAARLTITGDVVNVRQGPGTNYGIAGSVSSGMSFDILGKNPAGDWYQFCCVNGEQGWIYGPLVQVENAELVAVAQDIPAPPPTNTPAPVAAAPPPTDTPAPAPQTEPQPDPPPQPAGDPCANIGGDGCKFRVTGGPNFNNNGGMELKLQLFFIHSGVEGGQPQGSYFLALEKDGQRLPIPDSVRSIAHQRSEGPLGPYNYEYKMGASNLPGNNVAGNYVGWVLDGNGERDSQNFSFTVPEGQGEIWIQFDQG